MFVEIPPGSIDVVVMERTVIVITDTEGSKTISVSSDDMASALRTGKGFEVRGLRGVLRASASPTGQLTTLSVEHRTCGEYLTFSPHQSHSRRSVAASIPFSPSDAAWMAAL